MGVKLSPSICEATEWRQVKTKVLRSISGCKINKVLEETQLSILCTIPLEWLNRIWYVRYMQHMMKTRNAFQILAGKSQWDHLECPFDWMIILKWRLEKLVMKEWIGLNRLKREERDEPLGLITKGNFLSNYSRETLKCAANRITCSFTLLYRIHWYNDIIQLFINL
jgi:hypothetical protein